MDQMDSIVADVKLSLGEVLYECASEDTTKCQYTQDNADTTWPKVLSFAKDDTTITFTGENFYTAGYDVSASYNEIPATSVVVNSETEAVATFEGGVPIFTVEEQSRDERPGMIFTQQIDTDIKYKVINGGEELRSLTNPFTLTDM